MKSLNRYPQQQRKDGYKKVQGQLERTGNRTNKNINLARARDEGDAIDTIFGFERFKQGSTSRTGWLLNYLAISMPDETGVERSGLDLYFLDRVGGNFKATIFYEPYFYLDLGSSWNRAVEVSQQLTRRFEGCKVVIVDKQDLDLPNHLSGRTHRLLKISFSTVSELMDTKSALRPLIIENKKRQAIRENYFDGSGDGPIESIADLYSDGSDAEDTAPKKHSTSTLSSGGVGDDSDPLSCIIDLREYDVPYTMRAAIDMDLRVGAWYSVTPDGGSSSTCSVSWQKELLELCEPRILAFDIECEKSPLKFPNAESDRIYMISYMVKGQGYLIINREIVTEDIEDFEYTPKPHYPGPFQVMNEADEESLLRRFLLHIQELKPHIIVTYNGDRFDWPYVEMRCSKFKDLSLYTYLGIKGKSANGDRSVAAVMSDNEYTGRCIVHMDAFCWVQRDSYLPQGNQGLKAVTKNKLGYDPIEVDPEDMLKFARERPAYMASYSVSDAVATYYLYTTYVHNFIFSLSTIIPMGSEDVLRKGSGTLCEALLMVEAYTGNIICPNKQVDSLEDFHEGHLLENETYIGGHVECLEAGVFRADIPAKFNLVPTALQQLIGNIDRDLTFTLETEHGIQRSDIVNYDEVKQAIVQQLESLRDSPLREENPIIYHLDVGAMYPNIILTNRLQPSAMVSVSDCAACDFNRVENGCKRVMSWTWRGEYSPATYSEYASVRRQLTYEKIAGADNVVKPFSELSAKDQAAQVKSRLKAYSQRVYKKSKVTDVKEKSNTVCMRENSFYVDTVKAFRDRRYDYKLLTKTWKGKKIEAEKKGDALARKVAEDREILMDSLQLAHKCILNSFYGYVMRKGARWRSMEMAGIVTFTGAQLIKQARELVEQVGRPLELDTDGIWCILPSSFPQDFKFKTKSGSSVPIGYPCAMLNADVHERYTNHQYQDLVSAEGKKGKSYSTHSECSIFFELDGPYKAMVLPASPEEGRLLKKKYVVFNFNGTIAELKGFELKRRGELELVKIFQSQVFEHFLAGNSLEDCYNAVGAVANQWLDVLDEQGTSMDDQELLELISERKTISKTVEDYEGRKSTSLTTAARLADFLGAEMVKDKGLNCNLIISRLPAGAPVTERALPVAIFSCEPAIKRYFLRKWLKDSSLDCEDFRDVVDWSYYKERLGKTIQKIITIPAGMQAVKNPCPRVIHPDWLQRGINEKAQGKKQMSIQRSMAQMLIAPKKGAITSVSQRNKRTTEDFDDLPDTGSIIDLEDTILASVSVKGGLLRGVPVIHQRRLATEDEDEDSAVLEGNLLPLTDRTLEPTNLPSGSSSTEVLPLIPIKPMSIELPQSLTEFNLWLTDRKATWSRHRKDAKAEVSGRYPAPGQFSNSSSVVGKKKPMGVMDLVRNAALAATQGFWQIIELQESDTTPGDFTVWAMTAPTQLQRLSVVIPRVIYVNIYPSRGNLTQTEEAAVQLGGVKVRRELPHGRLCRNLYEISLSERKFQRNEHALNMFLCNSQVEGVYEAQVPLWFRGALKMGCVAKVNNSKLKSSGAGGLGSRSFKLQDVDLVNAAAHPYLQPSVAIFKRIFIYCAIDRNRNRNGLGVLGVFIIDSSNAEEMNEINQLMRSLTDSRHRDIPDSVEDTGSSDFPLSGKGHVWLINGYGTGSFDTKPPFQKLYRKFQTNPAGNVKFFANFVASSEEAMRQANERLNAFQRERHGPTIVIAQGSYDAKQWRYKIPMLQDFPLATIPANSLDEMLPAVGWQMFVAERMIQRFLIFPRWFSDRLQSARYALIPVCNLGTDALTTILDVVYARQLVHNRHILWISERNNAPDLGGAERDEHMIWSEALVEPVINDLGAYRSICVEMDIFGLAVCAIMFSGDLDAEGLTTLAAVSVTDLTEGSKAGTGSLSSDSSCARAFSIFKAVVAKSMDEMSRKAGPNARISDSLLTSVYRYLCGYGNGLLTDPALHRVVYNLMIKLFKKLIGGLVKMGTKVVHANFGRIIISTNKSELGAAKEYVNFILAAIIEKDIFACLTVDIKAYWEQLIWVGPENWGGIPMDPESDATVSAVSDKDMQSPGIDGAPHDDRFRTPNGSARTNLDKQIGEGGFVESDELEVRRKSGNDSLNEDASTVAGAVAATKKKSVNFSSDVLEGSGSKAATLDEILGSTYADDNEVDDNDYDADEGELLGEDEADGEDLSRKHWNLAKYLPSAAEEYFYYIIGEFMQLYKEKKKELEADACMTSPDAIEEELCAYMRHTITHSFTTKMLSIVDELTRSYLPSSHSLKAPAITGGRTHLDVFPKRAGSHLEMVSPALEFVKSAVFVMSLDPMLKNEVASLKKMLLTQLKVREFSEDSAFVDPCLSYVLRDVICNYCSSCRDFDLLRDSSLTSDDEANRWRCEHCFNQIDLEEVENRLVEELEHLTVSYQLQDLRCRKSRMISRRLCSAFSESSCAPLEMDFDEKQARRKLRTLLQVAQFHGFTFLKDYLKDLHIQ